MIAIAHTIRKRLDGIGMYRTVTLALYFLVAVSLALGVIGKVPYSFTDQAISLTVVLTVAMISNVMFARLWRVSANHGSAVITALIIFFLFIPASTLAGQWVISAVTVIAISSKFLFAWKKQHIFNPAAFGALALSAPGIVEATWWIGTPWLFVPLLVAGSLVVMKIRRWSMVCWCVGTAFVIYIFEAWRLGIDTLSAIPTFFTSWPILFLAFFMLTEPFTTPPTKKLQRWYGALVGGLSSATFFAPYIAVSPELALIIGNLAFYPFSLRRKIYPTLIKVKEITKNTKEFIFKKPADMQFHAGQYLEWTLPHKKPDSRGIRRYFTIASAPHESTLRMAVRFSDRGSTYKQALQKLKPGDHIIGSQRAGDFLLPNNTKTKLAFVAGGIGITPFLSHFSHIKQQNIPRDIVLFYCNNTYKDIAYQEILTSLADSGWCKVVHVLAEEKRSGCMHGFLTEDSIKEHAPDYQERVWYLSGPSEMVRAYSLLLKNSKVSKENIVRDFFPGLA